MSNYIYHVSGNITVVDAERYEVIFDACKGVYDGFEREGPGVTFCQSSRGLVPRPTYYGYLCGPFDTDCIHVELRDERSGWNSHAAFNDDGGPDVCCRHFDYLCAKWAVWLRRKVQELGLDTQHPDYCAGSLDVDRVVEGTDFWVREWECRALDAAHEFRAIITMAFRQPAKPEFK
jgi:hypothetical protein